jgi:hypothetical protein
MQEKGGLKIIKTCKWRGYRTLFCVEYGKKRRNQDL